MYYEILQSWISWLIKKQPPVHAFDLAHNNSLYFYDNDVKNVGA